MWKAPEPIGMTFDMQQLLRALHPPVGIGGHHRDGQVPWPAGEGRPLPAPAAVPGQRVAARLRDARRRRGVRPSE